MQIKQHDTARNMTYPDRSAARTAMLSKIAADKLNGFGIFRFPGAREVIA